MQKNRRLKHAGLSLVPNHEEKIHEVDGNVVKVHVGARNGRTIPDRNTGRSIHQAVVEAQARQTSHTPPPIPVQALRVTPSKPAARVSKLSLDSLTGAKFTGQIQVLYAPHEIDGADRKLCLKLPVDAALPRHERPTVAWLIGLEVTFRHYALKEFEFETTIKHAFYPPTGDYVVVVLHCPAAAPVLQDSVFTQDLYLHLTREAMPIRMFTLTKGSAKVV